MKCSLCLEDASLQSSHIIPEFLYQPLYDEKHRFHRLTTTPDVKNRFLQKGLRERLLCQSCEQHIAKFESYASRALKGGIDLGYRNDGNKVFISDIDYSTFKLFQISVLWRAGISNLHEFRQVRLGRHSEILRKNLLNKNPGAANEYGCLMFALQHEGKIVKDLVVEPTWSRLSGQKCYRFVFGGFAWLYVMSSHALPKVITDRYLSLDGVCTVQMQEISKMKFLVDTAVQMRDLGKLI